MNPWTGNYRYINPYQWHRSVHGLPSPTTPVTIMPHDTDDGVDADA